MGRGIQNSEDEAPLDGRGDPCVPAPISSDALPHVLYFDDFARFLNCTPAALRKKVSRGDVPRPAKLGGRLAWARATVLDFLAEIHGAQKQPAVQISARPYTYDASRMLVTFTLQIKGQPRQRLRKVAPAGLDHAGSLAWAKRIEGEVIREMLGHKNKEDKPESSRPKIQPVSAPPQPASKAPTLAEFWDRFLIEHVAKMKPTTQRGYSSTWRNYLQPTLGHVPLDMIDKTSLAKLRGALVRIREISSRNLVLYKLKTILETAHAWDILEHVPKIKVAREPKKPQPTVYSEDEVARLLEAADTDDYDRAIVLLLLHGGLRVSEVCALRWSDIDFRRGLMKIAHNYSDGHESTPKGGIAAPVGLSPELAAALSALPRRGEHVLVRPYKGQLAHYAPNAIRRRLNKLQEAAGLPESGPHLLRHTGITLLAARGLDAWRLQMHARHARISTTQRYVHLAREAAVLEAASVWAAPAPGQNLAQNSQTARKRRSDGELSQSTT